jgi:hypothetical protein
LAFFVSSFHSSVGSKNGDTLLGFNVAAGAFTTVIKTIVQDCSLYQVHRRKPTEIELCIRFYNARLKQLRRATFHQRLRFFWLLVRREVSIKVIREIRVIRGSKLK